MLRGRQLTTVAVVRGIGALMLTTEIECALSYRVDLLPARRI